jgi:hypothetical protein
VAEPLVMPYGKTRSRRHTRPQGHKSHRVRVVPISSAKNIPVPKTNPEPSLTQQTAFHSLRPLPPIRIVINWRRKYPAIDASAVAGADRACLTGRPVNGPRLTGIANDKGSMNMPMVLLGCLAHCWCSRHRRRYGQCQKSDRKIAHASSLVSQGWRLLSLNVLVS